jgi:Tetratricopeptide repeat
MQGREQLTLDQSIQRAASAGTLVRSEAVAVLLEVLRLASELQAIPDGSTTLLEENGTLTFRTAPGTRASDPAEPIRAACRLASRLFGAAKLEPPLSLAGAAENAPERFPTLRHLRDAFELELLLSGTPPPTEVERRMAIAAMMAKVRQLPGSSARPSPAKLIQPATEPDLPWADIRLPIHDDPSRRVTEPPEPVIRLRRPQFFDALLAAVRRAQPQWMQLVAVGAMGLWLGVLLGRGMSHKAQADPRPVAAALSPEIALPPPDVRPPPVVADSKKAPARAAPATAAAQAPPEGSPRPVRKLRRRAATAVADAASPAGIKLQAGDDSLKQGRFFEALMAYREALDQDPPVPAAARRLGDAYREHQDTDLAVTAYERYLELAPGAPDADEVRAAVEQLRSSTPLTR